MKKMDIGDIRPKEVIEVDDYKDQVLSNPNVQASGSHDQNQASTSSQVQNQQMSSSSSLPSDQSNASNQVQVLQLTNIARDHPIDSIIGDISRDVQIRLRLASFCHPLNQRR
jgi:predicted RND superfamily exporter protein